MFEFFRNLVPIVAPIFVISTMLNVGLTQKLSDIIGHLKNYSFVLKMLLANFVLVPLLLIIVLRFTSFDPAVEAGLLIFGLCAGAPFLIKLTQMAEQNIALGAALMILLVVVSIVYVPIVLPLVLTDINVDGWSIAKTLFLQMLLPVVVGMLIVQFLTGLAKKAQPWVGWVGNITLYLLTGVTLIGYFPNILDLFGTGAIFVSLAFILAAFGIGYLMGGGKDHLEDVGGLATAQRNTAAAIIIAVENFNDPDVLVIMTLANSLGIVMLMFVAKRLSRDNKVQVETV